MVLALFDINILFVQDHLWSVRFDYVYCEDIDHLLFEIWNRVTAQKVSIIIRVTQMLRNRLFLCENMESSFVVY
jgi:hypothetical protein